MSNSNAKAKYEAPIAVPLGGVDQGAGANCSVGPSAVGYCTAGDAASGSGSYCSSGQTAADYCSSVGASAVTGACTQGNAAGMACSAGDAPNLF